MIEEWASCFEKNPPENLSQSDSKPNINYINKKWNMKLTLCNTFAPVKQNNEQHNSIGDQNNEWNYLLWVLTINRICQEDASIKVLSNWGLDDTVFAIGCHNIYQVKNITAQWTGV